MALVSAKCTNCGGKLEVDNTKGAANCIFCKEPFIIQEAVNNYITNTTNNIKTDVVNIYGKELDDFEIVAGDLKKYTGVSAYVMIPETVSQISTSAFSGLSGLERVEIPKSVKKINDLAFANCTNLRDVKMPDSITFIGEKAFAGCENLANIQIPNKLQSLGKSFSEMPGLQSIIIPNNITSIDEEAFKGCVNLNFVEISDSVTNIKKKAFYDCAQLKTIKLSCNTTIIDNQAFWGCKNLESIIIPDKVTRIGESAFRSCEKLKELIIPNSVTNIGWGSFYGCKNLQSIKLPENITAIEGCAFKECLMLNSITIPDSVLRVGVSAFKGCKSLAQINGNFLNRAVIDAYGEGEAKLREGTKAWEKTEKRLKSKNKIHIDSETFEGTQISFSRIKVNNDIGNSKLKKETLNYNKKRVQTFIGVIAVLGALMIFNFMNGNKDEIITITEIGYQSEIIAEIMFDDKGIILDVELDTSNETKSYGAIVETDERFIEQFIGVSAVNEKEFDVVSGATYTSNAVIKAIESVLSTDEIIISTAQGYGGVITARVEFDELGSTQSVHFDVSNETPGIGTKIMEDETFIKQFLGISSVEELKIDVIAGSTITSNAAIEAVKLALIENKKRDNDSQAEEFDTHDKPLLNGEIISSSKGFQSEVKATINFNEEGIIQSIDFDTSEETPGWGLEVGDDMVFSSQFIGVSSVDELNIDIVAGATVTSEALIEAVKAVF